MAHSCARYDLPTPPLDWVKATTSGLLDAAYADDIEYLLQVGSGLRRRPHYGGGAILIDSSIRRASQGGLPRIRAGHRRLAPNSWRAGSVARRSDFKPFLDA